MSDNTILLQNVRLSFPALFKKTAFDDKQEPKFKAMGIMPKDHPQMDELKDLIRKVIGEKWDERPSNLKLFLRDGKEKKDMDGFGPDVVFFNASSDKRPGVYDRDRTPLVQDDGRPYAGCYVNMRITVWAQDNQYGKRINAELGGVQFFADGDAFGGGGAPATADDFPELEPNDGSAVDAPPAQAASGDDFMDI
jgi:hypothetical protein